jgi:hypothetical protein
MGNPWQVPSILDVSILWEEIFMVRIRLSMILAVTMLGPFAPALAGTADTAHCTTSFNKELQTFETRCSDGSLAVSAYEPQSQRWETRIIQQGPDAKPPDWAQPPQPRR